MIFNGKYLQAKFTQPGIAEIVYDTQGESVNTIDPAWGDELSQVLDKLSQEKKMLGAYLISGKNDFCMGANIKGFLPSFQQGPQVVEDYVMQVHGLFNRLEDLPFPTVAAVHGYCLGGGMEVSMAFTYRVAAVGTRFSQAEVKLGLIPGFGGCVRLPRLIGADHAIELIATGRNMAAEEALKKHLVSAVVAPESLAAAAAGLIQSVQADGRWKQVVAQKTSPLKLNGTESLMVFGMAKMMVGDQAGPHYPAPVKGVEVIEKGSTVSREEAQKIEAQGFVELAQSPVSRNLIRIFLGDQFVKRRAKEFAAGGTPVSQAAVVGAGIMGGGVAYQSASKGVPILMKDINQEALEKGFAEMIRLLSGQVSRGKLTHEEMDQIITRVAATQSYGDFNRVNLVVEAVVEKIDVKKNVLAETEAAVGPDAVIATNTSTISINLLAAALKDPTRFLGMHFFNPVYRMPLVEVIRGKQTSPQAVGSVVSYAQAMGKTPIVVNDGPGFLVNRILFPYFFAFQLLVSEGVSIEGIDKTMEKFGWPMGPALLSDVVGLDTGYHAGQVLAAAFPDMFPSQAGPGPGEVLFKAGYLGQKNNKGFYTYAPDKKGKPQKKWDPAVMDVLKPAIRGGSENIPWQEIIDRMMIPMVIEASRCLEDHIVESPTELDMACVYGIGFPPFRGGVLIWADGQGLPAILEKAARYEKLGKPYHPTAQMKKLAAEGAGFYPAL